MRVSDTQAPPTREASSPLRKTPRKSPEAARAAERRRAPQDASSPKVFAQKCQARRPPQLPENLNCQSPVRWRPGVRGASISPRESEGKAVGLDEDDDGAVRSEGSGPQSWPRAPRDATVPDVLRTEFTAVPDTSRTEAAKIQEPALAQVGKPQTRIPTQR